MIYTSYFANMRRMSDLQKSQCVSIARYTPRGVGISTCLALAPTWEMVSRYKNDKNSEIYIKEYMKILNNLSCEKVAEVLDNKILLCFEKPSDFCHRHIVSKWFNSHGFHCEELNL